MDDFRVLYEEVGLRLKRARELRGLTQEELASKTTLSRASIANIEVGRQRVPLHTLWMLAQVLSTPISSLLPENPYSDTVAISKDIEIKGPPELTKESIQKLISDLILGVERTSEPDSQKVEDRKD